MYYKKIKTDKSIIEFHNNWLGVETVIVNGQILSKKSSILGTNHYFTIFEEGKDIPYILTTKVNAMSQVLIDLRRDGVIIKSDLVINFGTKEKTEQNDFKVAGIKLLKEYEIHEAINALNKGLEFDRNDPEIYFYLACCYSIEEQAIKGFECIKKAIENNLNDKEMILNHEMLAYLRIQEPFEEFLNSNFTKYDENKFDNN